MEEINNPLKDYDVDKFVISKDDEPFLYQGESKPKNLIIKCNKQEINIKKPFYNRILLFNVHNFISVCNIDGENKEVGRQMDKFITYFNTSEADILFLTKVVPDYSSLDFTPENKIIEIKKRNHRKLVDALAPIYPHYTIDNTPEKKFYLANSIFSKFPLAAARKIHNIGTNRIIIECEITINDQKIILLLTHFQEIETGYSENVNNTIRIIKSIKDRGDKYIILGGDFNFPNKKTTFDVGGLKISKDNYLSKINEELVYIDPLVYIENIFTKITGFLKEDVIDLFFVSKDFLIDFDFSLSIKKNNLSDHYPVFLDFKYIDTKVRQIDSELKFIFNEIFFFKCTKKLLQSKLFYNNTF